MNTELGLRMIDSVGNLKLHVDAVQELTQQLIDLSSCPDHIDQFNALDTARVATQEKLHIVIQDLEFVAKVCAGVAESRLRFGLNRIPKPIIIEREVPHDDE